MRDTVRLTPEPLHPTPHAICTIFRGIAARMARTRAHAHLHYPRRRPGGDVRVCEEGVEFVDVGTVGLIVAHHGRDGSVRRGRTRRGRLQGVA